MKSIRNKLRVINATVILCLVVLFVARGLAQPVQQQIDRNRYSVDVMQDRADRLEIRLAQVEQTTAGRGDRLTRIEATLENHGMIIWAIFVGLIGIGIDRAVAAAKKTG